MDVCSTQGCTTLQVRDWSVTGAECLIILALGP